MGSRKEGGSENAVPNVSLSYTRAFLREKRKLARAKQQEPPLSRKQSEVPGYLRGTTSSRIRACTRKARVSEEGEQDVLKTRTFVELKRPAPAPEILVEKKKPMTSATQKQPQISMRDLEDKIAELQKELGHIDKAHKTLQVSRMATLRQEKAHDFLSEDEEEEGSGENREFIQRQMQRLEQASQRISDLQSPKTWDGTSVASNRVSICDDDSGSIISLSSFRFRTRQVFKKGTADV